MIRVQLAVLALFRTFGAVAVLASADQTPPQPSAAGNQTSGGAEAPTAAELAVMRPMRCAMSACWAGVSCFHTGAVCYSESTRALLAIANQKGLRRVAKERISSAVRRTSRPIRWTRR
jgi:hypothetical protein